MQVVVAGPSGFTRRSTPSSTTGYLETDWAVVNGGEYGVETRSHAADGSVVYATSYDPGFPMLPGDTTPGHGVTVVSNVAATGGSAYQSTRAVTVDGVERITVPAGTFDALKITAHITTTIGGDTYNVNWWVRGIGRVKIASYPASDPANGTNWELTGTGVAAVP